MKTIKLLRALGGISPELIEEAAPGRRKRPLWQRALALAACIALVACSGWTVIDRLDLFRAGCSAWPGTFADDRYYYSNGHGSVWCWDGQSAQKVLGGFWNEGWQVNEYGLFYKQGRSQYVIDHETGTRRKLFSVSPFEASHIGFELYGEDVIVRVYNKRKELAREVLIDSRTGEQTSVQDWTDYRELYKGSTFSDTRLLVGDRPIELRYTENEHGTLWEEEIPLLPDGVEVVSRYWDVHGDQVWFGAGEKCFYILRPDGEDRLLDLRETELYHIGTAAGDFAYWTGSTGENGIDQAVWCVDTRTGEYWPLENDVDMEFYEIVTDGIHLISCVPWDDYQCLWGIEYENGRPAGLTLLDEDLNKD